MMLLILLKVLCYFNSIKVQLELFKTDATDFPIPEYFNSIKVQLEHPEP